MQFSAKIFNYQILFLCFFTPLFQGMAQDIKSIEAYRLKTGEEIVLDGKLDEEFWENTEIASDFLMMEPVEGLPASERTVVRVAYDSQYLYIAAKLYDSEPDKIKAFQRRRDQSLLTDDRFTFILDTYNDQRSAYFFEINPLGLMSDALLRIGQGTTLIPAWNGIWRAWVSKDAEGWSAEIRIPFMTLNFDPSAEVWGINFLRTIRRKNEEVLWSGHRRNQGILRPQNAGKLTGLSGINQGLGLEAIHYGIVTEVRQRQDPESSKVREVRYNAGGELNYNITPNLKAGITLNTDFAETEVDDRQINLTRFPLFFPERRPFFLEGSNIFQFAPSSNPNPYFSRRVGLEDGRPIPIRYGARMIGRIKNTDVGFLHVRTGESEENSGESFTVGRVVQNFAGESTIGVMYTRRDSDDDVLDTRQTLGADLGLNTSRFLGNKNLQFEAFFVGHTETDINDSSSFMDRTVRGARINFPNQPWNAHVSYREFGINYNPAVGFAPRVGFRRLQPSITYNPLIGKSSIIRELSWQYYFEYLMEMDWRPATVNHRIRLLGVRFETGDVIQFQALHNFEYLDRPFDILRNGEYVIQPGDYTNTGYNVIMQTAGFRRIGGIITFERSGFWTGNQSLISADMFFRPFIGLNMTASWVHTQIRLQEGDFDTHLFRLVTAYDFSPWVSVNFNIQYDNVTQYLGTNSRFAWILNPGNTLFLVYNHNWQNYLDRMVSMEASTNIKLAYTFRF
jgi:hypothetical protein